MWWAESQFENSTEFARFAFEFEMDFVRNDDHLIDIL